MNELLHAAQPLIVDAVEAIYGAAAQPSRWPDSLQAIANCTGDVGCVLLYQRDDGSFGTIVSPSLDAAQRDYSSHWWQHDIRSIRGIPFIHELGVVTDRHVVSEEEVRTHPIFTKFLIPHGLGWFAAASMLADSNVQVLISVQRNIAKPRFSDDELSLIKRLGHHVEQSLRLSIRLIDAELVNAGLNEALSRAGVGVFVLGRDKHVLYTNDEAKVLIGDGFAMQNGALTAQFLADRSKFDEAIAAGDLDQVAQSLPPKPVLLQRSASKRALVIYSLPLASAKESAGAELFASARTIILAIDPDNDAAADPALVRDLLGLTLGEARVASLVGHGLSPRDAAGKLGITEETARTTLKRVFAKVGVSRQSELAALLSKLVLAPKR